MSNLPRIALTDLPEEERTVAEALIAALGDDLAALCWQGSWTRGEQTKASDHDFFLAMRRLDSGILDRIAGVMESRKDWSLFIKTEAELRQYPAHGRLQFRYGMTLLHGDFEQPPFEREHVLADIRALAIEIQHQSRMRLTEKSAGDDHWSERHPSLLYYWAKMAVLTMKARELLRGEDYPQTRAELRTRTLDEDELAIIDVVERWAEVKADYARDLTPLAKLLDRFVRKLVSELPAE